MLHPTIRVLALVLFAAALPSLPLLDLAVLAPVLAGGLAWLRAGAFAKLMAGVARLRWLLLAILVLYWGYTLGEPVHAALPGLSREGVLEGTRRMLVLVDLLAAVHWLLAATPVAELAGALAALARPLRLFGWDSERFARRMALVLQRIGEAESLLRQARARAPQSLLDAAADALREVEQRAVGADDSRAEVAALPRTPAWQWLLLPAFAWVLHLASR